MTEVPFKVILIGDCRVGKTSFLYSITNKHQNQIPPTIGVEYQPTTANVQGKTFRVNIWDTSGAQQYKSITSNYYRKCHGVILMFDVTDKKTFKNIQAWNQQIDNRTGNQLCRILVANKIDLVQQQIKERQVSQQQITNFCLDNQMTFKYTSAISGLNVRDSFNDLVEKIYQNKNTPNPNAGLSMQNMSSMEYQPINDSIRLDTQTNVLSDSQPSCYKCC